MKAKNRSFKIMNEQKLSRIFENSNEKNVYIWQKAFTLFQEKKGQEEVFFSKLWADIPLFFYPE